MNSQLAYRIVELLWIAFAAYFIISARGTKRSQKNERSTSRYVHIAVLIAAAILLFSRDLSIGILNSRFLPSERIYDIAGVGLVVLGLTLGFWARYHLGQYWSARITLKEGHRIIDSGPYAYVRHPIYSGLLLAMFGTSFVVGEYRALVAVLLVLVAHWRKAKHEEAMLTRELGDSYVKYRSHTGFLMPRLP